MVRRCRDRGLSGWAMLVHPRVLGDVNLARAGPEFGKSEINLTTSVITVILYFKYFNQMLTYSDVSLFKHRFIFI